jgi:uncharacterized membrane protein YfcA
MGLAESVIRKLYVVFLGIIGTYVLYDYINYTRRQRKIIAMTAEPQAKETFAQRLQRVRIPPMIHFKASGFTCSIWLPILVGFVTGVVASVLGVGGGFIRMPSLIYLIGCPTLVAIGTDLFEVMITGAYGAMTYAVKGRVDLIAAMWMLLGAAVGAQMGTIAVKYVRGYSIRLLFAVTIYIACASVLMKQLNRKTASSILILFAGIAISSVIIVVLINGIVKERASRRAV